MGIPLSGSSLGLSPKGEQHPVRLTVTPNTVAKGSGGYQFPALLGRFIDNAVHFSDIGIRTEVGNHAKGLVLVVFHGSIVWG